MIVDPEVAFLPDMIEVFLYGCSTCGVNALSVARLRKSHPNIVVNNSIHENHRSRHAAYLERAGIEINRYPAIIVVNDGARILRLSEWKSL